MRGLVLGLLALVACQAPRLDEPRRIDRERVGVVLIDAQPAFFRSMHGPQEPVLQRLEQLLVHTTISGVPIVATFEVPTARNSWSASRS